MRYQYKREPLTADEATRLANACHTHEEKLVVWTLLDTGLRVSELANLKRANLDWQTHRLMIYGKGGPYGSKSKRRVIPLPARIQPLIEGYFALQEVVGFSARTIQRMLKRVATGKPYFQVHVLVRFTPGGGSSPLLRTSSGRGFRCAMGRLLARVSGSLGGTCRTLRSRLLR